MPDIRYSLHHCLVSRFWNWQSGLWSSSKRGEISQVSLWSDLSSCLRKSWCLWMKYAFIVNAEYTANTMSRLIWPRLMLCSVKYIIHIALKAQKRLSNVFVSDLGQLGVILAAFKWLRWIFHCMGHPFMLQHGFYIPKPSIHTLPKELLRVFWELYK